ncbi:MAG: nucleotide exchange factor GrpE [Verrucomicrobiia bacterium]
MTDKEVKNTNTVNAEEVILASADDQTKSEQNSNSDKTTNNMENPEIIETQSESEKKQEEKKTELTKEELESLVEKASKADEYYDKLLRVSADYDNYRKRMARERQDIVKFANESLITRLLPVLDNFEAALNIANSNNNTSVESLKTGVMMIYNQLKNILAEVGLEEINAVNKPFDPLIHEAVSEQETTDVPPGHVVAQIRKGYKLNSRLIRPATVIVAKEPHKSDEEKIKN